MDLFAAKKMAISLMAQYNLIQQGWAFRMDNAKRRFGVCKHMAKTISISAPLTRLNDVDEVKDTILHEIAHALAGAGHGHDAHWKAMCIRVGARPVMCYNSNQVITPKAKYKAECKCGKVYKRHKRPMRGRHYICKCQKNNLVKIPLMWKIDLAG